MNQSNLFHQYLNIRKRKLQALWVNILASTIAVIGLFVAMIIPEAIMQPGTNLWFILGAFALSLAGFVLGAGIAMTASENYTHFKKLERRYKTELLAYYVPKHSHAQFINY